MVEIDQIDSSSKPKSLMSFNKTTSTKETDDPGLSPLTPYPEEEKIEENEDNDIKLRKSNS